MFEERQRLLNLQAENDELKLQEIQDRQRIQQLLSMTQPLEQTITYKQDCIPSSVTAYPKPHTRNGSKQQTSSTDMQQQQQQPQQQQQGSTSAAVGGERILRTVFLPTQDSDFLLLKIESLQAQLAEQVGHRGLLQLSGCVSVSLPAARWMTHALQTLQHSAVNRFR